MCVVILNLPACRRGRFQDLAIYYFIYNLGSSIPYAICENFTSLRELNYETIYLTQSIR